MTHLDDLEAKANEADADIMRTTDLHYICYPATILALIRVARAAKVINDSPNFVSLDALKDLDEALKELECI